MADRWTESQRRAIETLDADVCVAAGAGSGKTGVLVERFLGIVRGSLDGSLPPERRAAVDQILVITFTDKATREMKGRIVRRLQECGLEAERRQVETAYISTIHGFCSRLLKENPFEAGVDPEYTVLDDTEARRLLRAAFERAVEAAYEREDAEIIELVSQAQNERVFGQDVRDPLSALCGAVETALSALRGTGHRLEALRAVVDDGPEGSARRSLAPVGALLEPIVQELHRLAAELRRLGPNLLGAVEQKRRGVIEAVFAIPAIDSAQPTDLIATVELLQNIVRTASGVSRGRAGAPQAEQEAAALLEQCRETARRGSPLFDLDAEKEAISLETTHRFEALLAAVWEEYNEAKRAKGVLDNNDLQAEALALLERSPGVLARCRRRFRHILVDEMQDTDHLQMRIIELLHGSDSSTLFVVGDVQQSIYGWRGADPAIFRDLEQRFRPEDGAHVTLAENFRSRSELLLLINGLFDQIWPPRGVPFTPLVACADYAEKTVPSIEALVAADTGRRGYVDLEAPELARRIRLMVDRKQISITDRGSDRFGEPVTWGDIAILLRGLTEIEKYEQAFVREGIPYYVVGGGRGYYARHEVRDVMNVLTVIDRPLDDVALVAALRSPMAGLEADTLFALARFARQAAGDKGAPIYPYIDRFLEAERVTADERQILANFYELMERLRAEEDRLPVGRLLEHVVEATQYDAALLLRPNGRRRLANVRKLLQMAHAASTHGVSEFISRLREIERISDREGDAPTEEEGSDVARFLTIHKAKGLEFPVVFLADMGRGLGRSETGLVACDRRTLSLGCRYGDYRPASYRAIDEARRADDLAEADRLLYVALTRAREHLVLCGTAGNNRRASWSAQVFGNLGIAGPPERAGVRTLAGVPVRVAPMAAPAAF